MLIKGIEIEVVNADIARIEVDAIVSGADSSLTIRNNLAKSFHADPGMPVLTQAEGVLAKYIIDVVVLKDNGGTDESIIRKAVAGALKIADGKGFRSLAFSALGCETGRFEYSASAKIISQEIFRQIQENKNLKLKKIIFALKDNNAYAAFNKSALGYLGYISKKAQSGPFITVDAIIKLGKGLVVIERTNPPFGWALPGGFVDYGESLEEAVVREAKEETSLDLYNLEQFHTYSEYGRDPRFHTITTVFIADAEGKPRADSDAKNIRIITKKDLQELSFAFDHKEILKGYFGRC
ncbi:MAG: hypothetical protein COV72_01090 [Candidatus Omnitrophica bacterium CG11_big_fil_rev_8_21_14_0_20_42_13]|uniref:Nudix hydrolase domain-containing protein n=1 Tax=Candidatus Ghiorseimicrobium undicola TaxID=1974746 RepID=A0A2H0LZD0_9BACT|nr:MAG: hypothetical protein COV72_01090 [Candidatus Omnitrophica bacterium CG11_big_fil_rev_8_21_14_0_20_42_13]